MILEGQRDQTGRSDKIDRRSNKRAKRVGMKKAVC